MHVGVADIFFSAIGVLCNLSFIIQHILLSVIVISQRTLQVG